MKNDIARPDAVQRVKLGLKEATHGLIERETLADLIILSAVANEHLLVIGPPGTAKSEVVRRVAKIMGGNYFEYLLGRYTEPSEIFGPVDLRKLKAGTVETETTGMLPEADIAFLDEVFLGSTAILNTLLGILNERQFRRGHTNIQCPLRVCVGASNRLPEDESLAAFADRFLIHVFLEPVPDSMLEFLLEGGWFISREPVRQACSLDELNVLTQISQRMEMGPIRSELAHCIRLLRKAGVFLSDRRLVKIQRLISAAATLSNRQEPQIEDLWPMIYAIPTLEGQKLAQEVLHELLDSSENDTLPAAVEDASHGSAARARRILETGENLFERRPTGEAQQSGWLLELESLAREIDASFSESAMNDSLKRLRSRIVQELDNF